MILPERVLGRPGAHWMRSGLAIGPISWRTQATSSLRQGVGVCLAGHQRDVGVDALALDRVRVADHRGLGDLGVGDEGGFDLGRAHAVAGDVDHVVDPAGDPVVAVGVAAAAVAGEVVALVLAEVGRRRSARGRPRWCASGRASCRAIARTPSQARSRRAPRRSAGRAPPAGRRRRAGSPSRAWSGWRRAAG